MGNENTLCDSFEAWKFIAQTYFRGQLSSQLELETLLPTTHSIRKVTIEEVFWKNPKLVSRYLDVRLKDI